MAYALHYRTQRPDSILYKIRNGKGYATSFNLNQGDYQTIKKIVVDSIIKDISKNVKGKKIFIPDYITYALPATEKQFTGYFPSGTCITIPKDMIFGINWENVGKQRIDLDLSLVNSDIKVGWDAYYRTKNREIMFSGDMTSAPPPYGATELFYVKRQALNSYILFVNFYNFRKEVDVPLKIIIAHENPRNFGKNYMVNPNNVLAIAKTTINQKEGNTFGSILVYKIIKY